MPSTLIVPTGFSYVAASLVSTVFLLTGQSITVARNRKPAGVEYPRLYAEKAEMAASPAAVKFNCVQRAHQNTLENIAQVYMMTLVLGLKHPHVAASALAGWVVSRIAYTVGYASGNPPKRNNLITQTFYIPALLTLLFGSVYSAYELVSEGI
ncbi:membrane-associated proteins in eicosanoid and glutathione metabolism [Mycena epipterygia]|nr:membrane-associated proteins in eicosanoid and glutathione metabolism [Mycena epipterygia]